MEEIRSDANAVQPNGNIHPITIDVCLKKLALSQIITSTRTLCFFSF
jgi:hypothetical protein